MRDGGDLDRAAEGRLGGTRFAVLVFTNLTQDHLDFHGTMEEYFAAKAALFEPGRAGGRERRRRVGEAARGELPEARTFTPDDDLGAIDLKLRGRFNRANALGAVWAARELGVAEEAIREGIDALDGVPGRFESVEAGQPFAVIVDYAHTPDSLENVLRDRPRARRPADGRLRRGGDRDREKRPLMGRIAAQLADRAIVTTDNPRSEDPAAIAAEVAGGQARGRARPPARRSRRRSPTRGPATSS